MTTFSDTAKRSLLVISPAPHVHGGVSGFVETMKKNLARFQASSFYVGSTPHERTMAQVRRIIRMAFDFTMLIRRNRFDVIHINPTLSYKSLLRDGLILLILRMQGFRNIVVYFHGWHRGVEKQIKRVTVLRKAMAWLLNGTKSVLVLAPEFRQALIDIGVDKERVNCTRTMFDSTPFSSAKDKPNRRNILFLSRFDAQKGMYELLEAFRELADIFPDTDLIFAGDGKERDRLQALVTQYGLQHRVTFRGYIQGAEKAEALKHCDIFALPTFFPEGMPVALLEAMAAGKPLLTSKAGGIKHIIREPENGIVLDHVTVASVKDGLQRMLSDPAYCLATAKHNAEYAQRHFSAKIVTAELEEIFSR